MALTKAKRKIVEELRNTINKTHTPEGAVKEVVVWGDEISEIERVPSQSYALNHLLGGGWYKGKLHEFFGPEHAGKTSLAMMAINDFLLDDPQRIGAFIDVEHRFNKAWAVQLGLEPNEDFLLIQPPSAEAATDIMADLIRSRNISCMVYDSVGASATAQQQKKFEDQQAVYGGAAGVISRQVNTIAPLCNLFDTTLFYLNQLRADMDGFNRPMTPGGRALKHQLSARIYLRKGKEKYLESRPGEEKPVQVGFPMVFKLVKGNGPTPREGWSDFYYEPSRHYSKIGFDTDKELMRLAIVTGVVEQKSSWFYYGDIKSNGRDNFFADLEEAGIAGELRDKVLEAMRNGSGRMVELEGDLARPETEGPDVDDPEV